MYSVESILSSNVAEIKPLLIKLYPTIGADIIAERLTAVSQTDWECLCLRYHGEIVGVSGFRVMDRICYGKFMYVDHFIIDEPYRTKGASRTLLEHIIKMSRGLACEAIILDTFVTNAVAQRFWMNNGFSIVGFHFKQQL